jgi:hypothetical protein
LALCLDPLQLGLDPRNGGFALVTVAFGLLGVVADDGAVAPGPLPP